MRLNLVPLFAASTLALLLTGCDPQTKSRPTTPPTVRQPVIAIALGGGGAKGFAHIGVIKVLESHGIRPQIVTGTSAGSFVGSIYASGKTVYQLQQIAQQLEESDIRDLTLSRQGFVQGQKLQDFVNRQVGNTPIEKFPKRFVAVATALDSGKKIEFARGNAGQAVRASCSIPNVFVPATIAGKQYVDGGLVSPIPVETARKMGADIVIAVDISARPKSGQSSNFWGLLDQTLNIMGQSSIDYELKQADVVIKPAVGHLGVLDLTARNQAILAGEQAAQQQIVKIKSKIADFGRAQQASHK